MNSPVEEIKQRLSIEEVVGSYIELKQAGKALKALCPFHSEKTPSFTISNERQSFYCFGCNRGGDIFTFVEEFEGVDFLGALKILAEKANIDLNQYKNKVSNTETKEKRERFFFLLDVAKETYREAIKENTQARSYLRSRGITEETELLFEIGFALDSWDFILKKLKTLGFSDEEIKDTGLVIKRENGGLYDRFRNRIMFPILDSSGRTIAFSGRTLDKNTETAKYINSPETMLFKKRDILYGIDKAKLSIRKLNFSILVEGQMDLVLSHQAGFRNTVATSGTALRVHEDGSQEGVSNLELVKRISKNIVLAFDSDKAGNSAAIKNARLALSLDMDVKIAQLPEGKDPADVILRDKADWKQIIKESRDVIDFQLDLIRKNAKDQKGILKFIRTEVFETIQFIPSEIEVEHYLSFLSESLGLRGETLLNEYMRFKETNRNKMSEVGDGEESLSTLKEAKQDEKRDESLLLAAHILFYEKLPDMKQKNVERFKKEFSEVFNIEVQELLDNTPVPKREKYIFEIEADDMTVLEEHTHIEYLLKRTTIRELEKKAKLLLDKLKEAEDEADKEVAEKIFNQYSAILTNLENLKK